MQTVYILGSGFSAAGNSKLPTLSSLFQEIIKFGKSQSTEERHHLKQLIKTLEVLYPNVHVDRNYNDYPSFEEFLSLCYTARSFETKGGFYNSGTWEKSYLSALFLLTHCINSLQETSTSKGFPDPLTRFCERLKPGDVVITFNWDTMLEQCLLSKGQPFVIV